MNIITWNVAGWSTTVEKIKYNYKSVEEWLELLRADILCIQEVKLSNSEIMLRSRDIGATSAKFDTFWTFPKNSRKSKVGQGAGLNGVATFVRKGLTSYSKANVFMDPTLDDEGRCLMTDHGNFVVFNVYVPFSGDNHNRFPFKMRFLKRLRDCMNDQRALGKHVILVGDLNVAPRAIDVCREFRKINVKEFLENPFINSNTIENVYRGIPDSAPIFQNVSQKMIEVSDYLYTVWPAVIALLKTLTVETEDVWNKPGKRYRMIATKLDGKKVFFPILR